MTKAVSKDGVVNAFSFVIQCAFSAIFSFLQWEILDFEYPDVFKTIGRVRSSEISKVSRRKIP